MNLKYNLITFTKKNLRDQKKLKHNINTVLLKMQNFYSKFV
jgi:hypothetical protein